jgi:hypothetical protein
MEITGFIDAMWPTVQVTEKFKKREFVLEIETNINGNVYSDFAKFQLLNGHCALADDFAKGDKVEVHFKITGTKWERDGKVSFFTNLTALRIHAVQQTYAPVQPSTPAVNAEVQKEAFQAMQPNSMDDIPF